MHSITHGRFSGGALASLYRQLYGVLGALIREMKVRAAERQLQSFDDRMLGDMGIGRSEIGWAVRNGRAMYARRPSRPAPRRPPRTLARRPSAVGCG